MWYFSWILGVSLACSFGILNAMWYELREQSVETNRSTWTSKQFSGCVRSNTTYVASANPEGDVALPEHRRDRSRPAHAVASPPSSTGWTARRN